MFSQAWKKYLPVITILMKRSPNGEQTLDMNKTDFERAAGGRKAKLSFSITLHKGRIQNFTNPPPVARELSTLLQEDDATRLMIRQYDYDFTMTSGFQLQIRNCTPPADEPVEKEEVATSPE
ncbi:MAG: hypothetical protein IPP02_13640 [Chitinophagaceae bacterium]|jgi:hypothetical protein|nr:hypothetical protein [Chitinophagaceae bacterium]MBK7680539.1 hypothetical protein [Chitinophagaceae bacterium]MBK8300661.1 hypothetical protein [Chitinophagaceae bacterium]MBK9465163.1 hypothetical protein [Chitinophagaceae bacterium]MBK9660958.1 hypothetical protein [Chitinophagaceae bacterium]